MHVQPDQVDRGGCPGPRERVVGLAGGQREPELGVEVAGADVLVGVDLDAGVDPQQHPRHGQTRGDQGLDAVELVVAVDDDAPDAGGECQSQFVERLVVAVQDGALGGHAGGEDDLQLAAGGDVDAHPLLVHQPGDGAAQERLGCVGGAVAEHRHRLAATGADVGLVVDEQRGAVAFGQVGHVAAADRQPAVVVDRGGVGQQVERQRRVGRRAHMRSGADTPRRPRPTRSPTPAASASHQRAWRSSSGVSG